MVAVRGVFDGKHIELLESPPAGGRYAVIVTFVEALDDEQEVRDFAAQPDALAFWHDEREDLYQDYLPSA